MSLAGGGVHSMTLRLHWKSLAKVEDVEVTEDMDNDL